MQAGSGPYKIDLNLTPLLDLVMQMIMFFMITVNFVSKGRTGNVELPVVQSAVPADRSANDWVYLTVDRQSKVIGGNGENLDSLSKVKAHLQREKEHLDRYAHERGFKKGDFIVKIVLRVDKYVPYRDVWDVLDICSRSGYDGWQMRVMRQAK